MRQFRLFFIFTLAAVGASSPRLSAAPPPDSKSAIAANSTALSVRVVAYKIDAKLDPAKKIITATETLTYHNLTGQPQQTFPFHMYLNAFHPQSTWVREAGRDQQHLAESQLRRGADQLLDFL